MEENIYPAIEEEDGYGCLAVEEPAVAYTVRRESPPRITHMDTDARETDRIPLGMFGFYTDDPEVFAQRAAEIEADMDEIDAGIEDPEKWIPSEIMWKELYQKYPWLR